MSKHTSWLTELGELLERTATYCPETKTWFAKTTITVKGEEE